MQQSKTLIDVYHDSPWGILYGSKPTGEKWDSGETKKTDAFDHIVGSGGGLVNF